MKAIAITVLLLSGCSNVCPDCLTMTPEQLSAAMEKVWSKGYGQGFNDGEKASELRRLKTI